MSIGTNDGVLGTGLGAENKTMLSSDGVKDVAFGRSSHKFLQILQGEVMSVNLEPDPPENIGMITYRLTETTGKDVKDLPHAYPINSSLKVFPVLHEIVYVIEFVSRAYYFNALNLSNYVNNNASQGYTDSLSKPNKQQSKSYTTSQSTGIPDTSGPTKTVLGKTFNDKRLQISTLRPREGDILFQGRFGNNIRLGNNTETNAATIKIGIIDKQQSKFTAVDESLDTDTSVWLTTDEVLRFKSIGIKINPKNGAPTEYSGRQIALFSDRLVFGARANEIIMMSNKGIFLTTNKNFSVDSDASILLSSKNDTTVTAKNIYLGAPSATEHVVLGDKLVEILSDLIDQIIQEKHPTPAGPSGPPINTPQYKAIKAKLKQILSKQNYTL